MNEQDLATCECIIAHPSKPKFLVIKHTDRWSPPLLKFPDKGSIVPKTRMINYGMMNKYGLHTTVLRLVGRAKKYYCIELEMQSKKSTKKLNAVWVGSKEYQQFRSSKPGEYDPLEIWLKQKESRKIPVRRPTWERAAWFKNADSWIHHQLDRLKLQATSPVQQLRAFRSASCILHVTTAEERIFFKASCALPPSEAALTQALASNWPGLIPQPLAINAKKNWMLMRDYHSPDHGRVKFEDYPAIARLLADIQLDSLESMDDWKELGCPVQGLDHLATFLQQLDRLAPILEYEGETVLRGIVLNEEETDQLGRSGEELQIVCRELAEFSIPLTLVHLDIWYPNLIAKDGKFQISDWMGTVISHPFFSILRLIPFRQLWDASQPPLPAEKEYSRGLEKLILEAYLEPFVCFENKDRLQTIMALVNKLELAWRLFIQSREISFNEPESLSYQQLAISLQKTARKMIGREIG